MSMSRADALTYLQNQYNNLATYTGQATGDVPNGYGPAIDEALMMLGVAHSSLGSYSVADGSVSDYRVLLRLHALRQFAMQLLQKASFDVTGDGVNTKLNVQLRQIGEWLRQAEAEAAALGYVLLGNSLSLNRIILDFLEPETVV